jgi:ATP-dependent Clp protease ATP-binding subunit ClpB
VSLFVPFLPFSKPERAVVLHKFVLKLATRVREPIDLRPGIQNLIGHCRLTLVDDGQVCTTLSEQYYNKDLGARSLENAVANLKQEFTAEYSMMDGEITEDLNDGPLQEFLVRRIPVGDDEYEVRVYAASSNLGFDEEDDVGAGADDRSDLRDGDEEGIKGESSLGKSIDVGSKKKKNKATKK